MKDNSSQLELDLLMRLQENDEQALALLMERYYAELYNYAASFNRDSTLVKDCIQEVFISLWQRRDNATTILSPKYYLLRAVKNRVLKSAHRAARNAGTLTLEKEYTFFCEFSIEKMIIERQLSEEKAIRLKRIISTLSKRQQEIIYLKYYQHLEHGQIAELMNITTQSVYNLLHETIQKLKTVWHSEFVAR
ncbi:MAG TPA: sigma-70 family RNA polymerase sigma factor [Puia sp.]|jgi:RNA polymerase sigma factor (sigma-70 family)|nr:sigma-70 family RNA polymerase sigma factor [Puia sp.]